MCVCVCYSIIVLSTALLFENFRGILLIYVKLGIYEMVWRDEFKIYLILFAFRTASKLTRIYSYMCRR